MTDLRQTIETVASFTLKEAFSHSAEEAENSVEARWWQRWDWNMGVAFYGLHEAWTVLEDDNLLARMKTWLDARIEAGPIKACVNTAAPLSTALFLSRHFADSRYEEIFEQFDRYFLHEIGRTKQGLYHHVTLRTDNPGQVWVDTCFMALLYLQRRAQLTGNKILLLEARNQLYLHLQQLRHSKTGLFYHGWDDLLGKNVGVLWGRGNAWAFISAVEILNSDDDFAERERLKTFVERQAKTLERLQTLQGFWRTVLDDRQSYGETSATAGFSYAFLKVSRLGILPTEYREVGVRALDALFSQLGTDGQVLGASAGTQAKENALEYNKIPFAITPYSQGLALMALAEAGKKKG